MHFTNDKTIRKILKLKVLVSHFLKLGQNLTFLVQVNIDSSLIFFFCVGTDLKGLYLIYLFNYIVTNLFMNIKLL